MGRAKRKSSNTVNGDSSNENSTAEKEGEKPVPEKKQRESRSKKTDQDGDNSEPEKKQRELRPKKSESESNAKDKSSPKSNKKGSKIYEVEQILEKRTNKKGDEEFLIKWKGYSDGDNSWVPRKNLFCDRLLTDFLNNSE